MTELKKTKILYVITKGNWGGAIFILNEYFRNPRFLTLEDSLFSFTGKLEFSRPLSSLRPTLGSFV